MPAWGLSFCPAPHNINWTEVRADYMSLVDGCISSSTFMTIPNPFHSNCSWIPPLHRDPVLHTFLAAVKHDLLKLKPAHVRDNLTSCERHACKCLGRQSHIVIKSADKGSGIVIMDREWNINKCLTTQRSTNS